MGHYFTQIFHEKIPGKCGMAYGRNHHQTYTEEIGKNIGLRPTRDPITDTACDAPNKSQRLHRYFGGCSG